MHLETKKAYLLLGSNLGERANYLNQAISMIAARIGGIKDRSSIYETAAWGKTDQPGFLNIAVVVETDLAAKELLTNVLDIEQLLGRVRHEKWGSRLIDIDIILYGNEIVQFANVLQIPHPEMQNRKFVMQPMAEIAADVVHPVLKKTMLQILSEIDDPLTVTKI